MSQSLSARFWNKVEITDLVDCWNWTSYQNKFGYGRINVGGKIKYSHRIAWRLVYGEIPNGQFVCHKCDNPSCNNPNHLFLGTMQDNTIDMVRKGRAGRILTKEQVLSMRSLHASGMNCKQLSTQFNTEISNVYRIVNRNRWQHI